MELPSSFNEIVNEITRFTSLPNEEVEFRVWMEALEPGWNVMRDVLRFGVTSHHYNDKMVQLYTEGDGFIFDTLVFWAKPSRRLWAKHALERINLYCARSHLRHCEVRVLMLGDGVGNDSLYLADHGLHIDYFDVPRSKTFNFAMNRFEFYGRLNSYIHLIRDYQECLGRQYDVVLSFEVLEHLPEPVQSIRDISTMLKTGGIALITEDFGDIVDYLPTHLTSSAGLMGQTPFLFLKNSMRLSWYNRAELFKPYEFVKLNRVSAKHRLYLLRDYNVRKRYLNKNSSMLLRFVARLPYIGI